LYLSIVVPVYNECKLVGKLLDELNTVNFPEFVSQHEIIIVDDASTDDTYQIMESLIQDQNHIKLFKNEINLGKGASVKKRNYKSFR